MPKLTGEELSKLYPNAKTYDELHSERKLAEEARKPRFVAAKIALWASLMVPTVFVTYFLVSWRLITMSTDTIGVLSGVSVSFLLAAIAVAALYYLYSLIDTAASKMMTTTTPLYAVLVVTLSAAGGLSALLQAAKYDFLVAGAAATLCVFCVSFLATWLLLEKQ